MDTLCNPTLMTVPARMWLVVFLGLICPIPVYADDHGVLLDSDGDCIPDELEIAYASNPFSPDSDGDFISDGVEIAQKVHAGPLSTLQCPIEFGEAADTDEDGILDLNDADSDGDDIPDFMEAGDRDLNSKPIDVDGDGTPNYRDRDSDNDGLSDTHEVEFLTDPWVADTDGGGISDGEEAFRYFSDPNDPSDDQTGWLLEGQEIAGGGCGISPTGNDSGFSIVLFMVLFLGLLRMRKRGLGSSWRRMENRGAHKLAGTVILFLSVLLVFVCAFGIKNVDAAPKAGSTASIEGTQIRPTFDDSGFYGLRTARHLAPGEISVQGWLSFLSNTLSVRTENAKVRDLVSKRLESDFSMGIGLLGFMEAGFQSYAVLTQEAYYPGMKVGQTESSGFGDTTLYGKFWLPSPEGIDFDLAIVSSGTLPTGNERAYMGRSGMSRRNDLVASHQWGSVQGSINLGWTIQPRTEIFTLVDHHKIHLSGGVQNRFNPILSMGAELHTVAPAGMRADAANSFAAEMWFFFRITSPEQDIIMGGGSGMTEGYGTPGFRSYAGMSSRWNSPPPRPKQKKKARKKKAKKRAKPKKEKAPKPTPPPAPEEDLEEEIPPPPEEEVALEIPDTDGDGIEDTVDQCPEVPEDKDGWQDEDGCPEVDNDSDGILDPEDACPNDAEDKDAYQDTDGCPDTDNDNDGIPDASDKCPDKAEDINGEEDEDGCPDKNEAYAVYDRKKKRIRLLKKIEFGYMKVRPGPEAKLVLDDVAKILRDNPRIRKVAIQTHTDKSGKGDVNMWISRARGRTIRRYLVRTGGISGRRLVIDAYGETRNQSANRRSRRDRRVEFKILRIR